MTFNDDDISPANLFYQSVCSPEELPRILKPKTAADHLLRIQADPLTDHPRLFRVMMRRAASRNATTMLADEYRSDFDDYLSYLPEIERMMCEDVPSRYVLTNNYDAMCLQTVRGRVIVVSEVLRYFLYFMNLANLNIPDIPQTVRDAARLIAVRTLLLTETLDFDLDPRGIVPPHIHENLEDMVKWQMKFIIGHEYAHHNLGHSSDTTFRAMAQRGALDSDGATRQWDVYRHEHEQEFEADLHSIRGVEADEGTRSGLFVGGTTFLLNVFLFEKVAEVIDPDFADIKTHPPTIERFQRLVEYYRANESFQIEEIDIVIEAYRRLAQELIDYYHNYPDVFRRYGSIYLEGWRGPVLRDRVDY